MSPRIIEEAFNGARQMYEAGDITKEDYLKSLKSLDTTKISESSPENIQKKSELNALITGVIASLSMVE